ncbi:hypothetical protein FA95DRAFT_1566725 [Auriscalpium vulgare]|uniref:Uncharacterized protein n=1 Tax=Auriscalpium vulgare TaxID=40419 RepID=A0ACB8R7Q4_9AGAM|nr:hypothetical protein FA95DRAFT_1566725 [Auriscalpium vulgare]
MLVLFRGGVLPLKCAVTSRLASTSAYPFPSNAHPTPHQMFHLSPGATRAEIKSRYYDLVRAHHPDSPACRSLPPDVRHARFQAITAAYDNLRGRSRHHTSSQSTGDDIFAEELERRRAQHHRRRQYHARYGTRADVLNSDADEAWKDRIIVIVGLMSLIVGFAPALLSMSNVHEQRHLSASANLAAARREAREYGLERRKEIRKRVTEYKGERERPEDRREDA